MLSGACLARLLRPFKENPPFLLPIIYPIISPEGSGALALVSKRNGLIVTEQAGARGAGAPMLQVHRDRTWWKGVSVCLGAEAPI